MTDNLKLVGYRTLTPDNSNVASNYSLPSSTNADTQWCTNTTYDIAGANCANVSRIYSGNGLGAVYSWYAATAGSGTADMAVGDAPYSICPKNWYLPAYVAYKAIVDTFYSTIAKVWDTPFSAQRTGVKYGVSYDGNDSTAAAVYWTRSNYGAGSLYQAWQIFIWPKESRYSMGNSYRFQGLGVRCKVGL